MSGLQRAVSHRALVPLGGNQRAAWEMAAAPSGGSLGFLPTVDLAGSLSAWLDVASATLVSGDASVVPDLLNTNPAVQTVAARRPTLVMSNNNLPCLQFATNDVLSWPITSQSCGTNYAGWAFWVKLDAASGTQRLVRISTGTGGANGVKLAISSVGATATAAASPDGTTTKSNTSGNLLDTAWHFLTAEYNKDGATDAAKLLLSVDGAVIASITGTATLGALFAATGNILIGNTNDSASPANPLNGLLGPYIMAFNAPMAGVTSGLLTSTARGNLMNFQKPT